ncbi:hypothetical protein BO86DRAFT_77060 [Aspergillus japonicus CBS 114.51]|uniref:Uncharacterized protein n=1 Tax=Aspergillus japonicus CBS 114.51 TaxID=1448312 RepID=A0A8T8XFV0_ASPJA|nr:hypothetical protein BO86DRAFT_77060 [Aspergillus japonicus CBS 114.51]RAH87055.1 hypothetical protein BO86DRAFT_77060 [Aspergillus japonicus CBS 114.51]
MNNSRILRDVPLEKLNLGEQGKGKESFDSSCFLLVGSVFARGKKSPGGEPTNTSNPEEHQICKQCSAEFKPILLHFPRPFPSLPLRLAGEGVNVRGRRGMMGGNNGGKSLILLHEFSTELSWKYEVLRTMRGIRSACWVPGLTPYSVQPAYSQPTASPVLWSCRLSKGRNLRLRVFFNPSQKLGSPRSVTAGFSGFLLDCF